MMNSSFFLLLVLIFLAAILLILGFYLLWKSAKGRDAKRLKLRLRNVSLEVNEGMDVLLQDAPTANKSSQLENNLFRILNIDRFKQILKRSGLDWTIEKLFRLILLTILISCISLYLLHLNLALCLILSFCFGSWPFFYIARAKSKRLLKIEAQLPDALDLITRALRAGHAFPSGLQMAGKESQQPIAEELQVISDEINFGISMQQALMNFAQRVPSSDIRFFVIAVLIQRETGGNLTEILENISSLIRDRLKMLGTIRTLSAEGRISAKILVALPIFESAAISYLNPQYMNNLWFDPTGIKLVWGAIGLMIIGIFWMTRIIKINI